MKLIRSVIGSTSIALSRQFRRNRIIKTSNSSSIETSNHGAGQNIQWRGRSSAASVPSEKLEVKKSYRRVSKDERKSMVETYVKKYRELNAGKFPTAHNAMKDVGGSYYVVRQILQKLKYDSKMSSMDKNDTISAEKDATNKHEISTDSESVLEEDNCEDGKTSSDNRLARKVAKDKVLSGKEVDKKKSLTETVEAVLSSNEILNAPISEADTEDSSSKNFEPKEGPLSSIPVECDESKDIRKQFHHPIDIPKESLHSHRENVDIKEKKTAEDMPKFEELNPKNEQQTIKSEITGREFHKEPAEDSEPQRKPSVWQNLKSFANGILDIWRRP